MNSFQTKKQARAMWKKFHADCAKEDKKLALALSGKAEPPKWEKNPGQNIQGFKIKMSTRRKKKRPQGLTPLERYVLLRAVKEILKADMKKTPRSFRPSKKALEFLDRTWVRGIPNCD